MMQTEHPERQAQTYPWHQTTWHALAERWARLPHALLIYGRDGVGKHGFAHRLGASLLCLAPGELQEACGRCKSCQLVAAGTHPDLLVLAPADADKPIVVDQVRELNGFLQLRPHIAAHKVALIETAEAMNLNAANSLLKVLEEPPLGSVLILVSHRPWRLPVTVRSRCGRLELGTPRPDETVAWLRRHLPPDADAADYLRLADNAPLTAITLAGNGFPSRRRAWADDLKALAAGRADPVLCAPRWSDPGLAEAARWLHGFVADLIRTASAGAPTAGANTDMAHDLQELAGRTAPAALFAYLDAVARTRNLLPGPLDELLLAEDLLIRWTRLFGT